VSLGFHVTALSHRLEAKNCQEAESALPTPHYSTGPITSTFPKLPSAQIKQLLDAAEPARARTKNGINLRRKVNKSLGKMTLNRNPGKKEDITMATI
jgi:hypothetical protein